jgi:hypothetical protein
VPDKEPSLPVAAQIVKVKGKRPGKGSFDKRTGEFISLAIPEYIFMLVTIDPFDRKFECSSSAWSQTMTDRPEGSPRIAIDENIIRAVFTS